MPQPRVEGAKAAWARLPLLRCTHAFDRRAGSLTPQMVHYRIMSDLIIAGRCWSVVMEWQNRIVVDPNVLVGKPVIKGTRLAVEFIIDLLAQGWTESDILSNYPGLTREDILACLAYASARLHDEKVFPR